MLRRFTAALLAAVLLCSIPAAAAVGSTYSDVPPNDWAVSAIEKATQYGLMKGVGEGKFGYGYKLDRASFVTVLCNLFAWPAESPATPTFSDCAPTAWYYGAVEAALKHGAVEPGATFRPGDPITREEMAVMLVRALDYDQLALSLKDTALPFPDVTTNKGYIALAYHFGIITGSVREGVTYFFPTQDAPREQAAAMLVRAYERYTSKIDWLHGFYAFGSYPQIDMTAKMDAVSVGWARLEAPEDFSPYINQTTKNGNEWNVPTGSAAATDYFKENHIPYNLNVFCDGDALARALVDDNAGQSTSTSMGHAIYEIVQAAGPYNGVTIDFEGLRADNKDAFTLFMKKLRGQLDQMDKALWVAVQPPTSTGGTPGYDGFDFKALGEICDKVILMAHDYQATSIPADYVGTTKTNNPVTPFPDVALALAAITDPLTGVADKSKIALAIAIASAGYEVDADGKITAAAVYSPGVDTLAKRLRQPEAVRGWSDTYRNSYVTYAGDDGKTYRIWYEDALGVTEKVKLAAMFGVTGISLWRVGNLPNDPDPTLNYDVWGALQARR